MRLDISAGDTSMKRRKEKQLPLSSPGRVKTEYGMKTARRNKEGKCHKQKTRAGCKHQRGSWGEPEVWMWNERECQELRVRLNSKLNMCPPFLWKRDCWMWFGEKGDNSTWSNLGRTQRQTELHHWIIRSLLWAFIEIIAFYNPQTIKYPQERRFCKYEGIHFLKKSIYLICILHTGKPNNIQNNRTTLLCVEELTCFWPGCVRGWGRSGREISTWCRAWGTCGRGSVSPGAQTSPGGYTPTDKQTQTAYEEK